MKNQILLYFLIFLSLSPYARGQKKVEFKEALPTSRIVKLDLEYATTINIKIYDGADVKLSASASINEDANNDKYELEAKNEANLLLFRSNIRDMKKISKKKVNLSLDDEDGRYWGQRIYWDDDRNINIISGNYLIMDINYEISIPSQTSLIIETITGEIELTSLPKELEIKSVTGDIDLSVNTGDSHSFKVKTVTGDVFTNLKLNYKEKDGNGLKRIGGGFTTKLEADLNQGGSPIVLESTTGNIYLRKKEQ